MDSKEYEKLREVVAKTLNSRGAGHGINHAEDVYENARKALKFNSDLSSRKKKAILAAAFLHDVDDRKFLGDSAPRVPSILEEVFSGEDAKFKELVIEMIDLVSCSKNGNSSPSEIEDWKLYPRYADRLEALGKVGIRRCYEYTKHKDRSFCLKDTERTTSKELLYLFIATPERFKKYQEIKESPSMIDHYYDKLLHLKKGFSTTNTYFKEEVERRHRVLEDFILEFGRSGDIETTLKNFLKE